MNRHAGLAKATRIRVPRFDLKLKQRPEVRVELLLPSPIYEGNHPNHFSAGSAHEVDNLCNAPTSGNDVFNDKDARVGGYFEGPTEKHPALLALTEDELDPQGLRYRKPDYQSAYRRRRHQIDPQTFRKSLDSSARQHCGQCGVFENPRALDVRA